MIIYQLTKTSVSPWPEWMRGHRCHRRRVSPRCVAAGDTLGCSAGWRTWDRGHTWTAAPCCGHGCASGGRPSRRTAFHTLCTPHYESVRCPMVIILITNLWETLLLKHSVHFSLWINNIQIYIHCVNDLLKHTVQYTKMELFPFTIYA